MVLSKGMPSVCQYSVKPACHDDDQAASSPHLFIVLTIPQYPGTANLILSACYTLKLFPQTHRLLALLIPDVVHQILQAVDDVAEIGRAHV